MRRPNWYFLVILMVGLALVSGSGVSAFAQEKPYPTKSITYLVTFDPGGQSDREARRQQPILEKILGQKVIVDYKVGGGGALGWSELVRSQPDGYLMAGINIPHIILQPLQQQTGYTTEQIIPVAVFQRTPLALAVLKTSPYKDIKEFLAAARAGSAARPETQIFKRGQFTFNRRFIETKFSGFFGLVRRDTEKNLVLLIKSARGDLVVHRISRIAANDMHVEIHKGKDSSEVQIPFVEIHEIVLKHKDA